MMVDWKKVLQVDVPGEVYSKVERRINPSSGREKNFAIKDEIKSIIRDERCKSQFFGSVDDGAEVNEWICNDDDVETRILGKFIRDIEGDKKVTKLAVFDVFTKTGEESERARRIREGLVSGYSGVVKFLGDDDFSENIAKEDLEKIRGNKEMLASDFRNPEVFDLISEISSEFSVDMVDVGLMLNRYKWMLERERHWVPFSFRIKDISEKNSLSNDTIKRIFNKIIGSGVNIA